VQLRDAVEAVSSFLSYGGARQVGVFCFVSDGSAEGVELSTGCVVGAGGLCIRELLVGCCR
jgi:hypothetical protein